MATNANLAKVQAFYDSDLTFRVTFFPRPLGEGLGVRAEQTVEFVLKPVDSAAKKFKAALGDQPEIFPSNGSTGTTYRTTNTSRTARTSRRS